MKIIQIYDVNAIVDVCREYNLFTLGTNEEFKSLYKWNNIMYTDETLFEIAAYIYKYSNPIGDYTVETIAGHILREGVIRYID